MMTRRDVLATLGASAGTLGRAADRLPANQNVARKGPRVSYERCGAYVVNTLEPIYV